MRTRYRWRLHFRPEQRFSVRSLARSLDTTIPRAKKQRPSKNPILSGDNFIFIDVSTFRSYDITDRYSSSLSLSHSLPFPAPTPQRRNEEDPCLFPVVYSRVFFESSTSFLRIFAVARGRVHANRPRGAGVTAISRGDRWNDFWKSRYLRRA